MNSIRSMLDYSDELNIFCDVQIDASLNWTQDWIASTIFVSLVHPEIGTTRSYKASSLADAIDYLDGIALMPSRYHYWVMDIYCNLMNVDEYRSGWLTITNEIV